jgi:hypothetical protein
MGEFGENRERKLGGEAGSPQPADRDVYWDESLPGQSLTVLLFSCPTHGEEKVVEYYDPDDPPRCARGDLMVRKAW